MLHQDEIDIEYTLPASLDAIPTMFPHALFFWVRFLLEKHTKANSFEILVSDRT